MKARTLLIAAVAMLFFAAGAAQATPIRSAVGASIIVGNEFGPDVDIGNAIDQSGLNIGYTSGVDDFDIYLGLNPLHIRTAAANEYFAMSGTTAGIVEFDLGAVFFIDRIALWNEDATGISLLDILVSTNGINFTEVVSNFVPFDNPFNVDYPAEVISLGGTFSAQYVRFDMNACPPEFCSIGEVAFSAAPVPEPSGVLLFGAGMLVVGRALRRRAA